MNASEFIQKWRQVELRERQACQEHFLDLCELVGHPKPAAFDPTGERFCFERGAKKLGGEEGWADVWRKGYFGWEYKGKRKDLKAAYKQLNDYRENLENPPLLVVCDMEHIEVHTNFTNTDSQVYDLSLDALGTPEGMRTLRAVFFDPESLRPTRQRVEITKEVARNVGELAQALRSRGVDPHDAARFLDRLVFCMFAEDVGLLRKRLFSEVLVNARKDPARLRPMLSRLFDAMASGGFFGPEEIKRFNGNLFNDAAVLDLLPNEIKLLDAAAKADWSDVEPAVFGTLFERGLDPDKRSQIGAHFTSREDIETLVEPVVMQPLRREWDDCREMVVNVLATGKKRPNGKEIPPTGRALDKARLEADTLVRNFLDRLASVKVLDPACGSGNFLYVTLQKLMGLEREALGFAAAHGVPSFIPRVDPLSAPRHRDQPVRRRAGADDGVDRLPPVAEPATVPPSRQPRPQADGLHPVPRRHPRPLRSRASEGARVAGGGLHRRVTRRFLEANCCGAASLTATWTDSSKSGAAECQPKPTCAAIGSRRHAGTSRAGSARVPDSWPRKAFAAERTARCWSASRRKATFSSP